MPLTSFLASSAFAAMQNTVTIENTAENRAIRRYRMMTLQALWQVDPAVERASRHRWDAEVLQDWACISVVPVPESIHIRDISLARITRIRPFSVTPAEPWASLPRPPGAPKAPGARPPATPPRPAASSPRRHIPAKRR